MNGAIFEQYEYSIFSEFSPSGLEHTYIQMTPIHNALDVPSNNLELEIETYAINGLSNSALILDDANTARTDFDKVYKKNKSNNN